jgi:hypothetical protein
MATRPGEEGAELLKIYQEICKIYMLGPKKQPTIRIPNERMCAQRVAHLGDWTGVGVDCCRERVAHLGEGIQKNSQIVFDKRVRGRVGKCATRAVLLRRQRLLFVEPGGGPAAEDWLRAFDLHLADLGFCASTRLRAVIAQLGPGELEAVRALTVTALARPRAADRWGPIVHSTASRHGPARRSRRRAPILS